MILKKLFACICALAVLPVMPYAFAEDSELFTSQDKSFKNTEDGVVFEKTVPNGDYIVTVKTGGDEETNANIFINGGERVRAYTLEAGTFQDNEQPVVITDGKLDVLVKGENPNVTEIDVQQLEERTEPGEKPTIYIAGDSTAQTYDYTKVYPQTGWGQVFGECFTDDVIVENRSMGGRSSKSYNNDGRLDKILTEMHPGDYVFIQFGINDGAENKPERYISVEDYKALLTSKYIGEVEKRGGIPILLTATAASWWDEEKNEFMESRQDYAVPTKEVAENTGVTLLDINNVMYEKWNELGKDKVFDMYFICEPLESKAYPTGTDDHTHIKEKGAREIASLVADEVKASIPKLAEFVKPSKNFDDIKEHWAEKYIETLADNDYLNGVSENEFEPERAVSRAEFLKMAMSVCNIVSHAYRVGECLDVSNDDWYCYYLQSALDKGLIPLEMVPNTVRVEEKKTLSEATEDKEAVTADICSYQSPMDSKVCSFNGNEPITREEMIQLLMNCISYQSQQGKMVLNTVPTEKSFSDIDAVSSAYQNAVDAAQSYGITDGCNDNLFMPKAQLTRAEAAAIAARVIAADNN